MKRGNLLRSVLVLMLALLFVASAVACGSGTDSKGTTASSQAAGDGTSAGTAAETTKAPEPVTLTMLRSDETTVPFIETDVGKEIQKLLGITVDYVTANEEKVKILLSSGDLPDIVMLAPEYQPTAISSGLVVPLDDMLPTLGPDITKNVPEVIDFMKKFRSNDTGKLYFLPPNTGPDLMSFDASIGVITRWDYYKELNYPTINSEDDLLNVLKQMQEKHPKTADGKKVYGMCTWNDWGLWSYYMPMAALYGYNNTTPIDMYVQRVDTNEIINNFTNMEGPLWKTLAFYNKANKMGLFDPDGLTAKSADFGAKMAAGSLLYAPANWFSGPFNGENNQNAAGYVTIPLEWGIQWNGATQLGWFDKALGISKKCKEPERAMQLLNFLWSYDGARLVYSGVKGVEWDVVNGVPTYTDAYTKARADAGDAFKRTGVRDAQTGIYCGLSNQVIHPGDNTEVDLSFSKNTFEAQQTPLTKDFCAHYGVSYPAEIFLKNVESGKQKNQKDQDNRIGAGLPTVPDDITRTYNKLDEIMLKSVPKLILAKTDADYDKIKQQVLDDMKANGVEACDTWMFKAWSDTKALVSK